MDLYARLAREYKVPRERVKALCFTHLYTRPQKSPQQLEAACRKTIEEVFKKRRHAEPASRLRYYLVAK